MLRVFNFQFENPYVKGIHFLLMFSRKKQAKPLKAVPLKFVNQGENLDVANSILSVEMSGTKTPKQSRRKASTMSSQRRSASIERIFSKKQESKSKQELQKQLQELRQKEEQLTKPKVAAFIPPPPPPPPPANLLPPPPPPPPPPATLKKPEMPKERKIAPVKSSGQLPMKKEVNGSVPMFAIEQSTIQNIRSRLRKVNTQPKFLDTPPAPKEEKKDDSKKEIFELLKERVTSMRACLAASDSDDDDESESSSSSEDF